MLAISTETREQERSASWAENQLLPKLQRSAFIATRRELLLSKQTVGKSNSPKSLLHQIHKINHHTVKSLSGKILLTRWRRVWDNGQKLFLTAGGQELLGNPLNFTSSRPMILHSFRWCKFSTSWLALSFVTTKAYLEKKTSFRFQFSRNQLWEQSCLFFGKCKRHILEQLCGCQSASFGGCITTMLGGGHFQHSNCSTVPDEYFSQTLQGQMF